eukprot:IDg22699t1
MHRIPLVHKELKPRRSCSISLEKADASARRMYSSYFDRKTDSGTGRKGGELRAKRIKALGAAVAQWHNGLLYTRTRAQSQTESRAGDAAAGACVNSRVFRRRQRRLTAHQHLERSWWAVTARVAMASPHYIAVRLIEVRDSVCVCEGSSARLFAHASVVARAVTAAQIAYLLSL